jgi:hypothetical protein
MTFNRNLFSMRPSTPDDFNLDDDEKPVFDRELFFRRPSSDAERSTSENRRAPQVGSSKGLCLDCENRHHCAMQPRDGGVWHCEEYR